MDKIRISEISGKVFTHKGFEGGGCHSHSPKCRDCCCANTADIDRESYGLIIKNKAYIERRLGLKIEECFRSRWSGDREFLGGDSIESRVRKGYCSFHIPGGGCVLFELSRKGAPERIIPSICRLYPLMWDNGKLMVYDEFYSRIEPACICALKKGSPGKSLFETQQSHIRDIFRIRPGSRHTA